MDAEYLARLEPLVEKMELENLRSYLRFMEFMRDIPDEA